MTKKSYQTTEKYSHQAIANCRKYIEFGRRGALIIYFNKAGCHAYGSQKLTAFFNENKKAIFDAAKRDTHELNSEDEAFVQTVLPSVPSRSGRMEPVIYGNSKPPLLPYKLESMSEEECKDYLLPAIRRELGQYKSLSVNRIRWGDEKHCPPCWPSEIVPWENVSNPAQSQKKSLGHPICHLMKMAISRHLELAGIAADTHIDPDYNPIKLRNKMRHRGVRGLPSGQAPAPAHQHLALSVPPPAPSSDVASFVPPPAVQPVSHIQQFETPVSDRMMPMSLEEEPEDMDLDGDQPHHTIALDSEIFDETFEKDEDGRLVLARRTSPQQTQPSPQPYQPLHAPQPSPQPSPHPSPEPSPQPSPHPSPEPSPQPSPEPSPEPSPSPPTLHQSTGISSPVDSMLRPSSSRQLFPPEMTGRGKGKGGKKILIQRNELVIATNCKDQKQSWHLWKEDYQKSLIKQIKNKRVGESLNCKRCQKIIDKATFVAHNLKNCKQIHPNMKWMNYRKQFS